jgi:hypothetical protein
MLIIKEGLTDSNPGVMEACLEFLRPSLTSESKGDHDDNAK